MVLKEFPGLSSRVCRCWFPTATRHNFISLRLCKGAGARHARRHGSLRLQSASHSVHRIIVGISFASPITRNTLKLHPKRTAIHLCSVPTNTRVVDAKNKIYNARSSGSMAVFTEQEARSCTGSKVLPHSFTKGPSLTNDPGSGCSNKLPSPSVPLLAVPCPSSAMSRGRIILRRA